MRRRGVPLGGLLLCCLAATEAIWPFNTDSKKDNHVDRLETPVRFNCAAKYVDFNGGWVVDVVRRSIACCVAMVNSTTVFADLFRAGATVAIDRRPCARSRRAHRHYVWGQAER